MESAVRPVSGGGDVFLVGAYRRTLKAEAQQRNQRGNGGGKSTEDVQPNVYLVHINMNYIKVM